jgi:uncharacterized cofD-like protein
VVALGGGHGLSASLSALRRVAEVGELTAVVTVADNGGSSGRLRSEFGCLPPGDLRQALAALCDDDEWGSTWAQVLQHRFDTGGPLDHHAVGNLLIVALWELLGAQVTGLDWVAGLLGARGRVLPMSLVPLDIAARIEGADPAHPGEVTTVRGQVQVASTAGRVVGVELDPAEPPACPEAVRAIGEADWVVLGPGSWYTSVIPHLLVPELREAVEQARARTLVVLNLAAQSGETDGFGPETHLDVLAAHAPDLRVDHVLADPATVVDAAALSDAAGCLGAALTVADVARGDGSPRHDAGKLAAAFADVMAAARRAT